MIGCQWPLEACARFPPAFRYSMGHICDMGLHLAWSWEGGWGCGAGTVFPQARRKVSIFDSGILVPQTHQTCCSGATPGTQLLSGLRHMGHGALRGEQCQSQMPRTELGFGEVKVGLPLLQIPARSGCLHPSLCFCLYLFSFFLMRGALSPINSPIFPAVSPDICDPCGHLGLHPRDLPDAQCAGSSCILFLFVC